VALNLALSQYRAQVREINREHEPIRAEFNASLEKARSAAEPEVQALVAEGRERAEAEAIIDTRIAAEHRADLTPEKMAHLQESWQDLQLLEQEHRKPALLRAMLVSVEGYTVAGKSPTADELLESGDEILTSEIIAACETFEGLTPDQAGNWRWPGTSEQQAAGPAKTTVAHSAESESAT
jgi:hypothetical protein